MGGKVNDKVRIYVNGWFSGAKTPKEFGEKAKMAVQKGITAMKWDPFGKSYLEISNKDLNIALECVAEVRAAVGDDIDLLIEGHGRFNIPTGIKIAKAVLVTGACKNTSVAIVEQFIRKGKAVVFTGRNEKYYCCQLQTGENWYDRPVSENSVWNVAKFKKPEFMHRYGYYEIRCSLQICDKREIIVIIKRWKNENL